LLDAKEAAALRVLLDRCLDEQFDLQADFLFVDQPGLKEVIHRIRHALQQITD